MTVQQTNYFADDNSFDLQVAMHLAFHKNGSFSFFVFVREKKEIQFIKTRYTYNAYHGFVHLVQICNL